ncbi:MAG: glycoside hydrolase family 44 protein [Zavarzinella sp.]
MEGLRSVFIVFILGQFLVLWLLRDSDSSLETIHGQQGSTPIPEKVVVWSSDRTNGKSWDTNSAKVAIRSNSIRLDYAGAGTKICGVNWASWNKDATNDVSGYRTLAITLRQVGTVPDADLTLTLADSLDRPKDRPTSTSVNLVGNGIAKIDGEWRIAKIALTRFTQSCDLDLTKLWGINFSCDHPFVNFEIREIAFTRESPPMPQFPREEPYQARGIVGSEVKHTIPTAIYGACELSPDQIRQYHLSLVRWGGNRSSRYNFQNGCDNAGKDWFFKNGGGFANDPRKTGWFKFLRDANAGGAEGYVTVPMLGFVAKDRYSYSYSVRKYGKQTSTESGQPDVGSGMLENGSVVRNNDWRDTSVEAPPEFIAQGVQAICEEFGKSGVRCYVLDNEPMLWHQTHRDVCLAPLTREELWNRTVQYAEAIRKVDPNATIVGYNSWGWTDLFYSAYDDLPENRPTRPDASKFGGMPMAEWFIQKCGEYKQQHGKPLVDVFDFHWYPEARINGKSPYDGHGMDPALNELRLRNTRSLWDPTYRPESWIADMTRGAAAQPIRRIREWIDKHNPGMKLSLGEYNYGGAGSITGGLAQAELFAIFGREKLDSAFIWTKPEGTQELAWKLYRNYDGAGGVFGEQFVASSANHPDLTIHAARRASDNALTIVVINKNLGKECHLELDLPTRAKEVQGWCFDQDSTEQLRKLGKLPLDTTGDLPYNFPPASATILVVK